MEGNNQTWNFDIKKKKKKKKNTTVANKEIRASVNQRKQKLMLKGMANEASKQIQNTATNKIKLPILHRVTTSCVVVVRHL